MFVGYFDESGPSGGPRDVFTLGGFVAREERWRRVEDSWDRALRSRVFHMSEFENRRGAFQTWPAERKRVPLIASLVDSLRGNVALGVGHSLRYDSFKRIVCPTATGKQALRLAYALLLTTCLLDIVRLLVVPARDAFSIVCEEHDGLEGFATDVFHAFRRDHKLNAVLGTIAFVPKESFRGLQAADMVAYETFKHVTNQLVAEPARPVRKLFKALEGTRRLAAGLYTEEALLDWSNLNRETLRSWRERLGLS